MQQHFLPYPAVSFLTSILFTIWALIYFKKIDERQTFCSYNDLAVRKQWYKAVLAPLCHSSLVHVILTSSSLWVAREAESARGSIYFVQYSLVGMLVQRAIHVGATHWLVTLASSSDQRENPSRLSRMLSMYAPQLASLPAQGGTALAFCWLGFLSFLHPSATTPLLPSVLARIGLGMSMSYAYLPLLLLLVFQISMPGRPMTSVDCTMGLLMGYALFLSGQEEGDGGQSGYWGACLLLDLLLLCLHGAYSNAGDSDRGSNSGSGVVTMQQLAVTVEAIPATAGVYGHDMDLESGRRQPLLN